MSDLHDQVTAELTKLAEGRLDANTVEMLADGLNVDRFLDDDGQLDSDALAQYADRVFPKPRRRKSGRGTGATAARAEADRRFGKDRAAGLSGGIR